MSSKSARICKMHDDSWNNKVEGKKMCVICLECAVNCLSIHRRAVRQPYTFSKDSISLTSSLWIPQKKIAETNIF